MSLYRNSTRVAAASQLPAPAMGVTARGSFACEARCFCPLDDVVWVGERSGQISIRSARNGDVIETITLPFSKGLFASVMRIANNEMWVGTTDGRLIVIDIHTHDVLTELVNPETERNGEIFDICVQGNTLYTAMSSCRVCEWDAITKTFSKSYLLGHAVHTVIAQNSVLYCGDAGGKISQFDMQSSELIASVTDSNTAVTAMLLEESTGMIWCGRANGEIDVLAVDPNLVRVETIREAQGRINSLLQVGGKVWAGGLDKTLFVFHAHTRKLLGKLKDHSAFIFSLGKLYTMETARVWSMSNDKTVTVYDGEGFFEPIKGAGQGGHHAEVAELHAVIQTMKMDKQLSDRQLSVERDKVLLRDNDVDRITQEMNQQTLKIHALQHVADTKEERSQLQTQDQTKLFDEIQNLTKRVSELTVKLNSAEQDKAQLRGDVAKVQEELSRARSQVTERTSMAALADTERKATSNDKDRVQYALVNKEKENLNLGDELRRSRDQLNVRSLDLQRRENENEMIKRRMIDLEKERNGLIDKTRSLEEARRRMEDSVILRENEVKELLSQLNSIQGQKHSQSRDLAELTQVRQAEVTEAQKLQDNFVLRSHEFELLTKDRQSLHESLDFEKKQVHEARNNEMKLKMQNDELRRQLDTEKNNVKLLEDQYTIFQFVINSRGELVSSIWSLYNKMSSAQKALNTLENNVKRFDPTKDKVTLKREWKEQLVDRSTTSHKELGHVSKQVEYIVCNYFSEYEKMHLGISSAKFPPDANRQPIVGDQLLTKLRDVTLMKQVPKPGSAASNHGASYMLEASLPQSGYPGISKQQQQTLNGSVVGAIPGGGGGGAHPVNTLQTQNYMNLSQISNATGTAIGGQGNGASPIGYSVLGGPPAAAAVTAGAGTPASSIHASSGIVPTGLPGGQLLGVNPSGVAVSAHHQQQQQYSSVSNLGPLPPPENRPLSAASATSVPTPTAPHPSTVQQQQVQYQQQYQQQQLQQQLQQQPVATQPPIPYSATSPVVPNTQVNPSALPTAGVVPAGQPQQQPIAHSQNSFQSVSMSLPPLASRRNPHGKAHNLVPHTKKQPAKKNQNRAMHPLETQMMVNELVFLGEQQQAQQQQHDNYNEEKVLRALSRTDAVTFNGEDSTEQNPTHGGGALSRSSPIDKSAPISSTQEAAIGFKTRQRLGTPMTHTLVQLLKLKETALPRKHDHCDDYDIDRDRGEGERKVLPRVSKQLSSSPSLLKKNNNGTRLQPLPAGGVTRTKKAKRTTATSTGGGGGGPSLISTEAGDTGFILAQSSAKAWLKFQQQEERRTRETEVQQANGTVLPPLESSNIEMIPEALRPTFSQLAEQRRECEVQIINAQREKRLRLELLRARQEEEAVHRSIERQQEERKLVKTKSQLAMGKMNHRHKAPPPPAPQPHSSSFGEDAKKAETSGVSHHGNQSTTTKSDPQKYPSDGDDTSVVPEESLLLPQVAPSSSRPGEDEGADEDFNAEEAAAAGQALLQEQQYAATSIQRLVRGRNGRVLVQKSRNDRGQLVAAVHTQHHHDGKRDSFHGDLSIASAASFNASSEYPAPTFVTVDLDALAKEQEQQFAALTLQRMFKCQCSRTITRGLRGKQGERLRELEAQQDAQEKEYADEVEAVGTEDEGAAADRTAPSKVIEHGESNIRRRVRLQEMAAIDALSSLYRQETFVRSLGYAANANPMVDRFLVKVRCRIHEREVAEEATERQRVVAAKVLQRVHRMLAAKEAAKQRQEIRNRRNKNGQASKTLEQQFAAILVQRNFKCFLARKRVSFLRSKETTASSEATEPK